MSETAAPAALARTLSPFREGLRAALPLWLGIAPYGLVFGLLGPHAGLGAAGTLAMSLIVFAGSAQFVAVGMLTSGASYVLIVLTTLVVNLRHLLYGASVAPYLRRVSGARKAALSFLLTDEAFALVIAHFRQPGVEPSAAYYLGVASVLYVGWAIATAVGLALGGLVPDPAALGLDFALPATFIALLVPQLKSRGAWATVGAAGILILAARGLPGRLDILAATVVAATVGWGVEEWRSRS